MGEITLWKQTQTKHYVLIEKFGVFFVTLRECNTLIAYIKSKMLDAI
jgi:hypothetical protein